MMGTAAKLWSAYIMRWKRRRLLFRAVRKRWQIRPLRKRTEAIRRDDIVLFSTVRNETERLPHFLAHYRRLGVAHFLIVDNDSTDGTAEFLCDQPDVSVWQTSHSYKLSRFGMDWLTLLQIRHGHGHWCLTVDADEILVYPDWEQRDLAALTAWLDHENADSFGAIMLDMYPKGPVSGHHYIAGQNPFDILSWFDRGHFHTKYQPDLKNMLVRGGVRGRMFFSSEPERAPTLSKVPLIKWNRRFAYVSSTHSALPRRLNAVRGDVAADRPSGVLLHSKFLPSIVDKSADEKHRQEHFANSELYSDYYDQLVSNPNFWTEESVHYDGWQQLVDLGLMTRGGW